MMRDVIRLVSRWGWMEEMEGVSHAVLYYMWKEISLNKRKTSGGIYSTSMGYILYQALKTHKKYNSWMIKLIQCNQSKSKCYLNLLLKINFGN